MGYFPFYIDITDKNCVVVGGGRVALRKIEKLLPFGCRVTVVAPNILDEIASLDHIRMKTREFHIDDLDGAFMVICATDDRDLHKHIFTLCAARGILVNSVDDIENCSFIFPALATDCGVTAAITTSGEAPLYARYLREKLEHEIRNDSELIAELRQTRKTGKERLCTESERKAALEKVLKQYTEGV